MTELANGKTPPQPLATLIRAAALSLAAILCAPAHADSASKVVERDGKAWLYRDGKPLTQGYDALSIEQVDGAPDLVIATQNDLHGVLDAATGKVLVPVENRGVLLDTLSSIGLIEVRKDKTIDFVTVDGKATDVPSYTVVGDFSEGRQKEWSALAERDGALYFVTLNQGRFLSETAAPKYLPLVILPPELRQAPAKHDGPLNGVYVPTAYPDLKAAWEGWKRGELREAGQPAVVVRGDIAYVSFGEFARDQVLMPNTLRACQSGANLVLRDQDQAGGCASKAEPRVRFQRDSSGALRCVACPGGLPAKWVALPAVTQSLVGIGVALQKRPHDSAATIIGVLPNGPAAQSKLLAGDKVTRVDGKSIETLTLAQIVDVIRGAAGTSVKLDVLRGEQTFTVDIVRRQVNVATDAAGL
ncbi:PDZ domain-containing protein [Paraburkholderia bannensis]|uniref:PDZ domain-containing protein n=1 Tax=Paraburkholderia bannensis TaxID=765414 RepID=UPI002AC33D73|nr:PDZ domain-containing protein [Paraburkholderia bannensis]